MGAATPDEKGVPGRDGHHGPASERRDRACAGKREGQDDRYAAAGAKAEAGRFRESGRGAGMSAPEQPADDWSEPLGRRERIRNAAWSFLKDTVWEFLLTLRTLAIAMVATAMLGWLARWMTSRGTFGNRA
jgi:hypothetical protein